MAVFKDTWSSRDLSRVSGISMEQLADWVEKGLLKGWWDEYGILRIPLVENVAAYALRDGEDPDKARDELFAGRNTFEAPEEVPQLTWKELEDRLEIFRIQNNLPVPERDRWGDDDPRGME